MAEEHHRSKAANVRRALSEERERARSLKGSQADSARKLAKAEAELAVLRKQVQRVSEEARTARAAAKASFEANEHRDMVFVDAAASANRKVGPLHSLLLWLRCAARAWPTVRLVGKADDDVWISLSGTAAHLKARCEQQHSQPVHSVLQQLCCCCTIYTSNVIMS